MASALEKLAARKATVPTASEFPEREIPLSKIIFDKKQPRQSLHPLDGVLSAETVLKIDEMVESIKENGLIQAITVQELPDGNFLVVVGETRTRAHMKLGRATIRATVRNDLMSATKLLLYRLAENITRNDLTDDELAHSVRVLMAGDAEIQPMSQVEISKHLSKPQSWVTRYVRYGDDEVQRLWVRTKIADTVEKAYRLTTLPARIQIEIQRRVKLPKRHPEHLATPLLRSVIDQFAEEAKATSGRGKPRSLAGAQARLDDQTFGLKHDGESSAQGDQDGDGHGGVDDGADETDRAFAAAAADGQAKPAVTTSGSDGPQKYTLSADVRAALLGQAHAQNALSAAAPVSGKSTPAVRVPPVPPVNCRLQFGVLGPLLSVLAENPELQAAFQSAQCDLVISGAAAGQLANLLAGIVVNPSEVPAYLTNELPKLGHA